MLLVATGLNCLYLKLVFISSMAIINNIVTRLHSSMFKYLKGVAVLVVKGRTNGDIC